MDETDAVMLSSALKALLQGHSADAGVFLGHIKPSVLRDGKHKDAVRGLLAMIEDRAVEKK